MRKGVMLKICNILLFSIIILLKVSYSCDDCNGREPNTAYCLSGQECYCFPCDYPCDGVDCEKYHKYSDCSPCGSMECGVGVDQCTNLVTYTDFINGICDRYCSEGYCQDCLCPPNIETCSSLLECSPQSHECGDLGTDLRCHFTNTGQWLWQLIPYPAETACSDGFDNDCDGATDCWDSDCFGDGTCCSNGIQDGDETGTDCGGSCPNPCCTANGEACSGGSECCSGLCVTGGCRDSCDTFSGYGCSVDGNTWSASSAGTCYDSTPSTVGGTYGCDTSGDFRMNCGASCGLDMDPSYSSCSNSGHACDADAGGNFVQQGTCTTTGCDTISPVASDNGINNFYAACSAGYVCDSSVIGGDFSRDGYCADTTCATSVIVSSISSPGTDPECGTYLCSGASFTEGDEDFQCDSSNEGQICSSTADIGNPPAATGVCVDDSCRSGVTIRVNCGTSCDRNDLTSANMVVGCDSGTGDSCDNSVDGNGWGQVGICAGNICDLSNPCHDTEDGVYRSAIGNCDEDWDVDSNGDSCDSTVTSGDYSPDGMVTYNDQCTSSTGASDVVRVDASNGNFFVAGCDSSGDMCDSDITATENPWAQNGQCGGGTCCGDEVVNAGAECGCDDNDVFVAIECDNTVTSGHYSANGICANDGSGTADSDANCITSGELCIDSGNGNRITQSCSNCLLYDSCDANVADGFNPISICTATGCRDCTPPNQACSRGGDCCNGLCVNGLCRDSCSSYNGQECSDDGTNLWSADGICTMNAAGTWACDEIFSSIYSGVYYSACDQSTGNGEECDHDALAGGYIRTGRCGGSSCCTSVYVVDGTCDCSYADRTSAPQCDSTPSSGSDFDGVCAYDGVGTADSDVVCDTDAVYFDNEAEGVGVYFTVWNARNSYNSASGLSGDSCDNDAISGYSRTGMWVYSGGTWDSGHCQQFGGIVRIDPGNGYFVSGCDNNGGMCDISTANSDNPWGQTGLCVDGPACDGIDVSFDSSKYYGNCDGHGGKRCDSVASSGPFSQDGLCFDDSGDVDGTNFDCETAGFIFYDGTYYKDDAQVTQDDYDYNIDNDGRSCDQIIANGDYSQNGMVTDAGCDDGLVMLSDLGQFTPGCDDSANACDRSIAYDIFSPWTKDGICCGNSCIGTADSDCCNDEDCEEYEFCLEGVWQCVEIRGSLNVSNLGVTGLERTNPEFTSLRTVYLHINYSSNAQKCRYINYDSGTPDNLDYWTPWEACIHDRIWSLTENPGLKRVFMQINYSYGGEARVRTFSDSIYYNYTGSGLDTTPPFPATIIDGDYTNNNQSITIRWEGAYDPESLVLGLPLRYNYVLFLSDGTILDNITTASTQVTSTGFSLQHNTIVYANVTVINSAELTVKTMSDGLIIDLLKPYMLDWEGSFLNGSSYYPLPSQWIHTSRINFSWLAEDITSDVAAYSYHLSKGSERAPDNIPEGSIGSFADELEKAYTNLDSGTYYFSVKAKDLANNWGDHETILVRIDNTPPTQPLITYEGKEGNNLRYEWEASEDPESGISHYMINLTEGNIVRYSETTTSTLYTFSNVASGNYNATVGAKNGVGIWRWSFEDEYSMDTEPPTIVATPNGTGLEVVSAPVLRAWTNEQAVCYYNKTAAFSRFSFTNTTYHEIKVSPLSSRPSYKIKCIDGAGNENTVEIWFQRGSSAPDRYAAPTAIETYEGIVSKFGIYINNSNTKLAGVQNIVMLIGEDEADIQASDFGDGSYEIAFVAPDKAGTYAMDLNSIPIQLNVKKLYFTGRYEKTTGDSADDTEHIVSKTNSETRYGLASDGQGLTTNNLPGELSISEISLDDSLFILLTRPESVANKEKLLEAEEFTNVNTPSFGYSLDKYNMVNYILRYDGIVLDSEQDIQRGRFIIQNARTGSGKTKIIIRKA